MSERSLWVVLLSQLAPQQSSGLGRPGYLRAHLQGVLPTVLMLLHQFSTWTWWFSWTASAFPTLNILIILTPLKLYQGGPAKGLSFHPKLPQLSCARLLVTSACFSRASWNITALCHLHLPKGAEHRPLIRLKPFKLIVIGTHYRTEFKEAARELTAKSTQKDSQSLTVKAAAGLCTTWLFNQTLLAKMYVKVV